MLLRWEFQLSICSEQREGVTRWCPTDSFTHQWLRTGLFYGITSENTRENIDRR
jgi:hypothetical protein